MPRGVSPDHHAYYDPQATSDDPAWYVADAPCGARPHTNDLADRGGALVTWGSSGLGVAHGHDHLQHGLVTAALTTTRPTLGQVTEAGVLELALTGHCCTDALRTTLLLGNPATVLKIAPVLQRVWLPQVQ